MQTTQKQGRKSPAGRVWHKSKRSNSQGACVEVSEGSDTLVRDTQNRHLGHLSFSGGEWAALVGVA